MAANKAIDRCLRVLLVDDEPLARQKMRLFLADQPDVEIVGECEDGPTAVDDILRLRPDLVFLDVQMPGTDGFAVLDAVRPEYLPEVVFVTAHDNYAIKAFEIHALDYLLKPFDRERFLRSLSRARATFADRGDGALGARVVQLLDRLDAPMRHLTRFVVRMGGRVYFLRAPEVDWLEAEGNYVVLHVGKEKHLIRDTMCRLEARLDPGQFVRVHRSTIVNLERIKELRSTLDGELMIVLEDGCKLAVSRGFRDGLQRLLDEVG
ncbi:MAG TPA: LytTR family DNA-binding domain-containing protein [Thermoanaerobaculaceae bacterium]|nr:LytTR family DNA-binding domain-containing protein [Thermoanaerobaculaceae bacterium]HPS78765.1 LytTR family DNA-binding domain-containing protein [Thermoanaerobaculaceae bacterium]